MPEQGPFQLVDPLPIEATYDAQKKEATITFDSVLRTGYVAASNWFIVIVTTRYNADGNPYVNDVYVVVKHLANGSPTALPPGIYYTAAIPDLHGIGGVPVKTFSIAPA